MDDFDEASFLMFEGGNESFGFLPADHECGRQEENQQRHVKRNHCVSTFN